jgi:hypothetical protein
LWQAFRYASRSQQDSKLHVSAVGSHFRGVYGAPDSLSDLAKAEPLDPVKPDDLALVLWELCPRGSHSTAQVVSAKIGGS